MEPADQGGRVLLRIYVEVHETRPQLFISPEGRVGPPEAVLQGDEPAVGLFVDGVEADGTLERGGRGVGPATFLVQFGKLGVGRRS